MRITVCRSCIHTGHLSASAKTHTQQSCARSCVRACVWPCVCVCVCLCVQIFPDTLISAGTYRAARRAAGSSAQLATQVLSGLYDGGVVLTRPPGTRHTHAREHTPPTLTLSVCATPMLLCADLCTGTVSMLPCVCGGCVCVYVCVCVCVCVYTGHQASRSVCQSGCVFNNAAVAAVSAREAGAERVLILDWDFHHGQGTQVRGHIHTHTHTHR